MTETYKVLVADDHSVFREGLRHVLKKIIVDCVVIEANDFDGAMSICSEAPTPNLLLVDLFMPGMDAANSIPALRDRCPEAPIIIISISESLADMRRVFENGASAYIPKTSSTDVLLAAINLVVAGGTYWPQTMLNENTGPGTKMAQLPFGGASAEEDRPDGPRKLFTRRQYQVLMQMAQGKPNKVIASDLGITLATVKVHVNTILSILKVNNRTQAVLTAQRLNLVPEDEAKN